MKVRVGPWSGLLTGSVLICGCAGTLPRTQRLPVRAEDSCRVRTWNVQAKGMPLPEVPLVLLVEEESDHLAGILLGDWGRPLVSFRQDGDQASQEKGWFTGVGMEARELTALSLGLNSLSALQASAGAPWDTLALDSTSAWLRHKGARHSLWSGSSATGRGVAASDSSWHLKAELSQEDVLSPGSCRGR